MKASKIFRYLLAFMLLVPFCQIQAEERDESTYTAKYKFNYGGDPVLSLIDEGPIGASLSSISDNFKRSIVIGWEDRVYLEKGTTGTLKFANFRYEIKSITYSAIESSIGGSSITVSLTDYKTIQKREKFTVSDGVTFSQKNILEKSFDTHLSGIKEISITQENNDRLYFQGANNNTTPTFIIEYFLPYVTFNEKMPSALKEGNSISLNDVYSIVHEGAFTKSDVTFEIDDADKGFAEIQNNQLKAKNPGLVHLYAVIKNNGEEVSRQPFNVTVYDGDFTWSQGLLYMDYFDNTNTNRDYAYYSGKPYDALRLMSDTDPKRPYVWGTLTQGENGDMTVSITTKESQSRWRAAVGMIDYTQHVPAYTSLVVRYDNMTVLSERDNNADDKPRHGAELIYLGESPWVVNNEDQFSTYTSSKRSIIRGGITIAQVASPNKTAQQTNYYQNSPIELSNAKNGEGRNVSYHMALTSFMRYWDNVSCNQTATFSATGRKITTTYYAYISYDGNGGTPIYTFGKVQEIKKTVGEGQQGQLGTLQDKIFTYGDKELVGWNTKADGTGVSYKLGESFDPEVDGHGVGPLTLYAQWDYPVNKVTFHYTDPSKNILAPEKPLEGYKFETSNNSSLSGTIIETPLFDDYLFDGWYEEDGRNKAYDANGNAVEGAYWKKKADGSLIWNYHTDVNLYPQWIKDATNVEIAEIRLNNFEGDGITHNYVGVSVSGMTSISNFRGKGYITVDGVNYLSWHKNGGEDNLLSVPLSEAPVWNIDAVDGYENKVLIYTDTPEGRKYLGNKVENSTIVEDAIGIETSQPAFYFTIYNERGWICLDDSEGHLFNHILYMKTGNVWEYENTGDNPQYNPIRILAYGSSVSYGDLKSSKVISEIKKKLSTPVVVNGVNTYPYAYNGKVDADLCKGILYVDMGGAASVIEANANELVNFKKEVSDNCLFFMPSNYTNTGLGNNVVSFNGTNYNSLTNLVIKDKVPFFNPYKFHVGNGVKASYHRDYDYKWNSMCLPFPVKLSSDMKYYKLYGSDNLRLAFVSMSDDVIAANTPVACYGNGTFTLENTGIDVPADVDGEKVYVENVDAISCDDIKDYVENKKGTPASQTWNFKGVRFDTYVYGTKNTGTLPNRAEKSLVYYFANDEFRYVNPEGRVKFAPYRAFLQAPDGLFAKSYRILVFDEEGATDITDIVDAAEGDGKIYDLQGRRVKTPLKGHVYVVGGKKRLY